MHYIVVSCTTYWKKVGHDARAIVDMLVDLATNHSSPSIRLKASDMLLERGWGKMATVQPETTSAPMFNLPAGAYVAIRVELPEPPAPPTFTMVEGTDDT